MNDIISDSPDNNCTNSTCMLSCIVFPNLQIKVGVKLQKIDYWASQVKPKIITSISY